MMEGKLYGRSRNFLVVCKTSETLEKLRKIKTPQSGKLVAGTKFLLGPHEHEVIMLTTTTVL
jgi:hypothetical protein